MFTHLHVHTEYSLLDGMGRIPQLIARTKELGMESLAITDHGVLHGIVTFYREAKEANIKPILGCELYVAPRERHSRLAADKNPYHLVVLARNEAGYHNLLKLATAAQLEGFYYKPRVDKELLSQHSEGLIALSACPNGELGRLILAGRLDEAEKAALWHKEVFGHFYLELQDHAIPELARMNEALLSMSKKLDLPLAATNDVHYVHKADHYAHDVLLCIQTNNTIHNDKRPKMPDDSFYLKSPEEMASLFAYAPDALSATQEIADMCSLELDFDRLLLPTIDLPPGNTADDYLAELSHQGLQIRYPGLPAQAVERLDYELDVIRQTEFADYFLVIWDVISYTRAQGILFGVRGSAAASIVLYCLGITDIDPLSHRLVFERFLNIERKEMPDIDLDFQDDRRDEVIAHVSQKYGSDRVAQIITFGTLGARAAIRDVGRALGLPYSDVDRVARQITAPSASIQESLDANYELRNSCRDNPTVKHLIDTAAKLEGVARHASTHAAGVVISRDPLLNNVPLQRPSKSDGHDINMTQFAMADIAHIGLLKMDFLGLTNLTILHKATEIIAEHRGVHIDLQDLPLDDADTFALLSAGETTGVFQLEGAQMRHFIRELHPTCFGDIAAMVALYRPGPKDHIPTFIRAKHGLEPIRFPHPALAEILEETYGVIVYQDQVLLIVQAFAGYSLGEADIVRKAMGKKIPEVMKKEKRRFLAGAKGKGFTKDVADQVWALIEPFAGYAFNKAHSVSYALIAYQTAYLKAKHPVEFMCALLAINVGQADKAASAVDECHRLNITVLGPDVNSSDENFTIERCEDGTPAIRFGLAAIKNVGATAVRPLISARKRHGTSKSIEEFCRQADLGNLNKRAMESMIKAGAFDSIDDRGTLLASIDRILSLAQTEQRLKEVGQTTMFDLFGQSVEAPLVGLELNQLETSAKDKLAWEKELLGVYLSEHPFALASKMLASEVDALCGQINEDMVGQTVVTAGVISSVRQLFTKNARPFASVVLEDLDGAIEVTAWNDVFEHTRDLWQEGNTLIVKGKVKSRADRIQITCQKASLYKPTEPRPDSSPQRSQDTVRNRLRISLRTSGDSEADVARLRQIFDTLSQFPGDDVCYLSVISDCQVTDLELPDLPAAYSPELHRCLTDLLGEENVVLHHGS